MNKNISRLKIVSVFMAILIIVLLAVTAYVNGQGDVRLGSILAKALMAGCLGGCLLYGYLATTERQGSAKIRFVIIGIISALIGVLAFISSTFTA